MMIDLLGPMKFKRLIKSKALIHFEKNIILPLIPSYYLAFESRVGRIIMATRRSQGP